MSEGIGLHINCFKRPVEDSVLQGDIAYAGVVSAWWNSTNAESKTLVDNHITDHYVLSAVIVVRVHAIRATISRFNSNCIIVVCNVASLDEDIPSTHIYAVSI